MLSAILNIASNSPKDVSFYFVIREGENKQWYKANSGTPIHVSADAHNADVIRFEVPMASKQIDVVAEPFSLKGVTFAAFGVDNGLEKSILIVGREKRVGDKKQIPFPFSVIGGLQHIDIDVTDKVSVYASGFNLEGNDLNKEFPDWVDVDIIKLK